MQTIIVDARYELLSLLRSCALPSGALAERGTITAPGFAQLRVAPVERRGGLRPVELQPFTTPGGRIRRFARYSGDRSCGRA